MHVDVNIAGCTATIGFSQHSFRYYGKTHFRSSTVFFLRNTAIFVAMLLGKENLTRISTTKYPGI